MELKEFSAQPCKTQLAFEFLPKKKTTFDLEKTARNLREKGIEVQIETPVFLAIRFEGENISLFKSGKIMVKETREEPKARKIAEKFLKNL